MLILFWFFDLSMIAGCSGFLDVVYVCSGFRVCCCGLQVCTTAVAAGHLIGEFRCLAVWCSFGFAPLPGPTAFKDFLGLARKSFGALHRQHDDRSDSRLHRQHDGDSRDDHSGSGNIICGSGRYGHYSGCCGYYSNDCTSVSGALREKLKHRTLLDINP
ncbi:hypothetical protein Ancab_023048 [Ancistrocladus abbreviatus]